MNDKKTEKGAIGSSFDDFLAEEGITDEANEMALKKAFAVAFEKREGCLQKPEIDHLRTLKDVTYVSISDENGRMDNDLFDILREAQVHRK
jgi:hypothetical protein